MSCRECRVASPRAGIAKRPQDTTPPEGAVGPPSRGASGRPGRVFPLLARYLGKEHRDNPAAGCPIPALVSEIPRQPPEVRQAYTAGVREAVQPAGRTRNGCTNARQNPMSMGFGRRYLTN